MRVQTSIPFLAPTQESSVGGSSSNGLLNGSSLLLQAGAKDDPALNDVIKHDDKLYNLIVDDKNHLVYCYVPKVNTCTMSGILAGILARQVVI